MVYFRLLYTVRMSICMCWLVRVLIVYIKSTVYFCFKGISPLSKIWLCVGRISSLTHHHYIFEKDSSLSFIRDWFFTIVFQVHIGHMWLSLTQQNLCTKLWANVSILVCQSILNFLRRCTLKFVSVLIFSALTL